LALESGVKKKPSVYRGPKAISAIKLPKPITSAGVRQLAKVLDVSLMSRPGELQIRKVAQHRGSMWMSKTKTAR
jgi:hypothetical protein